MPKIPGINHLEAVRALEKAGFRIVRQGKHVVMSDGVRILTIPRHNPVNALTMGGIVQDARSYCRAVPQPVVIKPRLTSRSSGRPEFVESGQHRVGTQRPVLCGRS